MIHQQKETRKPQQISMSTKVGMIFGLPDLPETQDVIQQLGFPITSITCFMSSWWWRASILGWGGSSDGMTRNSLHPVDHPWMTSSLVVWSTGLPTKKHTKNSLSRPLHQKKFRVKIFGWIHLTLGGGGEMGFWVTVTPQKIQEKSESILPAARGRCIDLELAAKLASPTSTFAELSHDCQRPRGPRGIPVFRGNGWDLGSKDFFWASKRLPSQSASNYWRFVEIPWSPKNVTCHPGGNDCGLKGEVSSCNLPLLFLMVPL